MYNIPHQKLSALLNLPTPSSQVTSNPNDHLACHGIEEHKEGFCYKAEACSTLFLPLPLARPSSADR
ncbi:hypothetical protein E2C01_040959 [Portunus trituberculatus]|uniref:Uncharacterized protein n=1 Tax=Portunus trituberculatus TaxID=210409 RepID=A0A5B7FQL2_PORTR|nr:hypothetical protein [Portunus trituberculatus]